MLLETIKINNGIIENIKYHQKRFDISRAKLFETKDELNLIDFLNPPKNGLFRCRISYDKDIKSIEYATYEPKIFKKFKVVSSNIEYSFKYANRKEFEDLKSKYPDFDEIIIEKNGFLTDTTISNIAFFDGKKWLTPASPLLKGTMRAKLIDDDFLELADIKSNDIKRFKKFALLNAMLGFYEIKNYDISN
jgi:4-amino-4-deoxychorismate lyase